MPSQPSPTVLIAGALGVVGRAAIEHFASLEQWRVVGLSRRAPDFETAARFVSADLLDPQATRAAVAAAGPVTLVVYAALSEEPSLVAGWRDDGQMQRNLEMLRNLLDAVERTGQPLRQLTLLQGTKAYGHHVERMRIPGKEDRPRHPHANFYWLQEDLVRERQAQAEWTWTVLRPQLVVGWALNGQMIFLPAIGAHAAICRELGEPLSFPGAGRAVKEATDARILAQAMAWAAEEPRCANQIYNITNGDSYVWEDIWPVFAEHFGVELGAPRPRSLAEEMPARADVWARVAERHGLRFSLQETAGATGWQFVDYLVSADGSGRWSSVMSTIKAREHGFQACIDSERCFHDWLSHMQDIRILPR
jgi:nucleoside-diphosphate-sugar epimerase